MLKKLKTAGLLLIALILLAGCNQAPSYDHLKDISIVVDGDPQEWAEFPVVHEDPEGDNISYEYDISTVKAFANNDTRYLYILVQGYIPAQEFTSIEVDLQYGDDRYRVGLLPGEDSPGVLAREIEGGEWEVVDNLHGAKLESQDAIEITFPIEYFPASNDLKIANLRIMGGICCNQYEYYAIDTIIEAKPVVR